MPHEPTIDSAEQANLRRLASFPERNPNPVIEVDLDLRVTYVNPLAREHFPRLPELGAAHPMLAGLVPIVAELQRCETASCTREVRCEDRIYEQAVVYLPEIQVTRLYIHDITSLRQLQAQLVLSEKLAALGQLTAGIAHEMNTPLGAIRSTQDTLMRATQKVSEHIASSGSELADDAKLGKALAALDQGIGVMREASERVIAIVSTMRSFARLDEAEVKRVDLNHGITSAVALLRGRAQAGHVHIVTDLGDLPELLCAPARLNQTFLALLQNAVEAIDQSGTVTVITRHVGERIEVTVQDDGRGMPPRTLAQAFEPGFTTKGAGVGTGLGLTSAKQTVQDHAGELNLQSAVGAGTQVTLRLPLAGIQAS